MIGGWAGTQIRVPFQPLGHSLIVRQVLQSYILLLCQVVQADRVFSGVHL